MIILHFKLFPFSCLISVTCSFSGISSVRDVHFTSLDEHVSTGSSSGSWERSTRSVFFERFTFFTLLFSSTVSDSGSTTLCSFSASRTLQ